MIGVGQDRYNVIVDAFRNSKLGGFARIVVFMLYAVAQSGLEEY